MQMNYMKVSFDIIRLQLRFFFLEPRLETTNLTATVSDLKACEIYTFKIGIIGPMGYGPLSKSLQLNTFMNTKAPPKKLTVMKVEHDPLKMLVQWSPSCPTIADPIGHIVCYNGQHFGGQNEVRSTFTKLR